MDNFHHLFISNVARYIKSYSQFPIDVCNWIGCQFALESSFGASSLAKSKFNFCGMRNPLVRISTSYHAGDGSVQWAEFDDLESCCIDYLLCLQYYRPTSLDYQSVESFARFIKKFYCPSRDYIDNINKIFNQFN